MSPYNIHIHVSLCTSPHKRHCYVHLCCVYITYVCLPVCIFTQHTLRPPFCLHTSFFPSVCVSTQHTLCSPVRVCLHKTDIFCVLLPAHNRHSFIHLCVHPTYITSIFVFVCLPPQTPLSAPVCVSTPHSYVNLCVCVFPGTPLCPPMCLCVFRHLYVHLCLCIFTKPTYLCAVCACRHRGRREGCTRGSLRSGAGGAAPRSLTAVRVQTLPSRLLLRGLLWRPL